MTHEGTRGGSSEEDPTSGLAGLQAIAEDIVNKVPKSLAYQPGDAILCHVLGEGGDDAPLDEIQLRLAGGYAVLSVLNDQEPEPYVGDIGSFPLRGVSGCAHHLEVRDFVGSPASGDPTEWLTKQLTRLRDAIAQRPEGCILKEQE